MRQILLAIVFLSGCGSDNTSQAISSCSVEDHDDGSYTMSCPDGSSVTWYDGTNGSGGPTLNGGTLNGSIEVQNIVDVMFLSNYTEITGDLIVSVENADLPSIEKVGGSLILNNGVATVDLSSLSEVTENFMITRTNLTSLDNIGDNLVIGGDLMITENYSLGSCWAQEWATTVTVGGTVYIVDNLSC
ncbi:MAG: hypothetical protein ACWGQW_05920 [bacterium]